MATKSRFSEAEIIEQDRVALENAENQPTISEIMADLGYGPEEITEGKSIHAETSQAYDFNKIEDDETSETYSIFKNLRDVIDTDYSLIRKKAKVVFRKDSLTADKLMITGSMPRAYIKWLEVVKKFNSVALSDSAVQSKLVRLKVTEEGLKTTNTQITELETARTEYLREVGESQAATKAKDAAFAKLDDWMSEFYAVARIGLEDNPQLLESLGKYVKS